MDGSGAQGSTGGHESAGHGSWGGSAMVSSSDNNANAESSDLASSSAWGDGTPAHCDGSNAASSKEPDNNQHTSNGWCDESSADALTDASSSNVNDSENQSSTDLKVTTRDESSNPDASSSHQSTASGNGGWSISEDGILRGMKEGKGGGAGWADIASALRRSKSQVKARWRVIKDKQPPTSGEDLTEPEKTTKAEETLLGDQVDGNVSGIEDEDNGGQNVPDSGQQGMNDKPRDKGKDTVGDGEKENRGNVKQRRKKEATKSRWHKGARNSKVAAENKQAKSKAHEGLEQALSGEEASSESSASSASSSLAGLGYGQEEWRRQMHYLQDHMYASLYPPEIRPEPDAHFSARDCRLLAVLDSKQKRNRWLAMQADFYNVTGRMVPLDVLRDKCERAETERGRTCIEKWVDDVSHAAEQKRCQ